MKITRYLPRDLVLPPALDPSFGPRQIERKSSHGGVTYGFESCSGNRRKACPARPLAARAP